VSSLLTLRKDRLSSALYQLSTSILGRIQRAAKSVRRGKAGESAL